MDQRTPSTRMYRGAPSHDLWKCSFPGTFLSIDETTAAQYRNVTAYAVAATRFLDMDEPEAKIISEEFLESYPGEAPNVDPEDEDVPSDLFLFPTKNWVDYLKARGFEGTSVGSDRFVFDQSRIFPNADAEQPV